MKIRVLKAFLFLISSMLAAIDYDETVALRRYENQALFWLQPSFKRGSHHRHWEKINLSHFQKFTFLELILLKKKIELTVLKLSSSCQEKDNIKIKQLTICWCEIERLVQVIYRKEGDCINQKYCTFIKLYFKEALKSKADLKQKKIRLKEQISKLQIHFLAMIRTSFDEIKFLKIKEKVQKTFTSS